MTRRHETSQFRQAAERRLRSFVDLDGPVAAVLHLPFVTTLIEGKSIPRRDGASVPFPLDKPQRAGSLLGSAMAFVAYRRRRSELLASGLFDPKWYLQQYADVGAANADPLQHFLEHGAFEGRSPGPMFDPRSYVADHPDVAAARIEAWRHFALHGKHEGRSASATGSQARSTQRNAQSSLIMRSLGRLARSPRFVGHLDALDASGLRGWILDPADPSARVEVSVYVDEHLVARIIADEFREDLLAVGSGDGHSGFTAPIANRVFFEGRQATVFARINDVDVLFGRVALNRDFDPTQREPPAVHLDLSDLIPFMCSHSKVSGIQRVQVELMLGLMDLPSREYDLSFCARGGLANFSDVPVEALRALLRPTSPLDGKVPSTWHDLNEAIRSLKAEKTNFRAGDVLLTVGAPWAVPHHADALSALKSRGVRYFQVLYDIVPIAMPEVFDAAYIPSFVASTAALVTHADRVFAISRFSKMELEAAAKAAGAQAPPCDVILLGDELPPSGVAEVGKSGAVTTDNLKQWGILGPFVLCVSTIEPRKNHALLYSVWRRLLKEHGPGIPQLVLVGRVGWYMESFIRSLQATDFLSRRIVLVSEASDQLLQTLYQKCMFTVFPSFYEGWGLPIVESLANGKVCVCSSAASMPEAGQDLAIYVDPNNASGAYSTIDGLIHDRRLLTDREDEIRRRFKHTPWAAAAEGFSIKVGAAVRELAGDERRGEAPLLRTNHRYRFELPLPGQTAQAQFEGHVVQSRLARVCHGPYWYELERDRRWACGGSAVLSLDCESSARAALIEICVPAWYLGESCEVRLDDAMLGTFTPRTEDGILHLPLGTPSHGRGMLLELSFGACAAPPPGPDKRLLGPGLRSIMTHDGDRHAALTTFLEAETSSRYADSSELARNVIELGMFD